MEKHQKTFFFVFWMDMINQDIKKPKNSVFLVFNICRFGFLHWKSQKQKTLSFFLISWLIISIQKTKIKVFSRFSISKPKNKKLGITKNIFESKANILSFPAIWGSTRDQSSQSIRMLHPNVEKLSSIRWIRTGQHAGDCGLWAVTSKRRRKVSNAKRHVSSE